MIHTSRLLAIAVVSIFIVACSLSEDANTSEATHEDTHEEHKGMQVEGHEVHGLSQEVARENLVGLEAAERRGGKQKAKATFAVTCYTHTTDTIDLALDLPPEQSHIHGHSGPKPEGGLTAETTLEQLHSATTNSCPNKPWYKSLLWHPQARIGWGEEAILLKNGRTTVYYADRGRRSNMVQIPDGAELIGGVPQSTRVWWECGNRSKPHKAPPFGCQRDSFKAVVEMPNCYSGSGTHYTEFRYRSTGQKCHAGFRRQPDVRYSVLFRMPPGMQRLQRPLLVSAGGGEWELAKTHMHADIITASTEQLREHTTRCIFQREEAKICKPRFKEAT
jgi:hypothetical protein